MALATAALGCPVFSCLDEVPKTRFDLPQCVEYDLNQALIESARQDDRSAIELLQQRYESTFTHVERHRIAAALLGRATDDSRYWNELASDAKDAIRFAYVDGQPSPEYVQWCAARGVDPGDYRWMSIDAFRTAARDPRARDLLAGALDSKDVEVLRNAVTVLINLRDESYLPALDRALARFPDEASEMAFWLMEFNLDAADQLALKFIPQEDHETYWEQRRTLVHETMSPSDP